MPGQNKKSPATHPFLDEAGGTTSTSDPIREWNR
ncbi:MAG: hypothetical protein K0R47_2312 [Brevibacillus sp.]|nr:hypothetical protein [Brevibacillus sp.]